MQWYKVYALGPNCTRAYFWSFPTGRGFMIAARKALRHSSSGGGSGNETE